MPALSSDSYTARRLQHATPEHVHLTSRRAFIGPIPEGWLNSHRKQWYRRYVTSDSHRAPTFTAAHPIASSSSPEAKSTIPTISVNGNDGNNDTEAPPRPSSQSAVAESAVSNTATSVTSLLHDQHQELSPTSGAGEQVESQVVAAGASVNSDSQVARGILPRRGTAARTIDKVTNKVQTQKVRFSDATKFQLRAKAQRLAARGNFHNNIKDGAVMKMDRMLVRIDITQQSIGVDFDERLAQAVETKSMDKWREYMVVCRRHSEEDAESVLQLYKTRVIKTSAEDYGKAKRNAKVNIPLSPTRARVNLYSSLDKTLCVWTLDNSRTTIYYLRPQSGATSVEWYTFLRTTLGWKRAQTLQVNVPDLSVTLRLDDPFKEIQGSRLLSAAAEGDENAMAQVVNDEKAVAGAIVARCIDMLKGSPQWSDVLKAWARDDCIGLAWKRYDRLEWVHGAVEQKMFGTIAMARTHDLQLRPKDHYPLKTITRKGNQLEEPSPIEGFLIRLTSKKGQELKLKKMRFKRLYFTTQDQYLVFLRPGNATPPPPPRMTVKSNGNVPTTKELTDKVPLTFDVDPYPLLGGTIEWLSPDAIASPAEQRARDKEAAAESERNATMLLAGDGFIDLCNVKHVRKMHQGASPVDESIDNGPDVDFDFGHDHDQAADDTLQDDGTTNEVDEDRTFELIMSNGLVIRLQAYDKAARKEWMVRLRQLAKYWRHRARSDMDLYKSTREQNLRTLQIDERAEANIGSFAYKWEVGQSYASPLLYNMCGIAQCRTIHLSGLLFRKPRRHTTFSRCRVILSNGHLLIYQDTLRSSSGKKLLHIHHERISSISLSGCYLYSGLLTENDLLYQNRTFDSNTPGHRALPRMYIEDNWTSTDEDAMTTFTIWHAKSKSWFRSSQFVDDARRHEDDQERNGGVKRKVKLTRVSQLGATGRSVVFKARSRAERDHWVMAIQVEIERLAATEQEEKGDDVRLVGEESG